MRLSGFVVASLLFVSATLVAQHSAAGGGGGASAGGYSGGSSAGGYSGGSSSGSSHSGSSSSGSSSSSASSHGSSAGSSGSSHNSGSASSSGGRTDRGKTGAVRGSNERARFSNEKPEKKGFFSFLRHKKPEPKPAAFVPPIRCRRGENCRICRGAGNGACIVETSCATGLVWNGFSCGSQYGWWNDCSGLASQLAAMRRQGLGSPGQSLMYRVLLSQYESCMARFGAASFSAYPSLFDTP